MASKKVKPVPEGYHTLTPHIIVKGAAKAIEFYKKAFGAEETLCLKDPNTGSVCHAEVKIGDSYLMMCEENEQWGAKSPVTLGGTASSVHLYVKDVDAVFAKAVKAGGKPEMEPADQFWGDRHGVVVDPFGHRWGLATHIRDLTAEQIEEGAKKWRKEQEACQKKAVAAKK